MEDLISYFDIHNTFFAFCGYNMSYIEFFGTFFGLISVWLATRANIHTWTTGILNVIAFYCIYFQIQLYSDMFLQIFFLATSILGLWQWLKKRQNADRNISSIDKKDRLYVTASILLSAFLLGLFMSNIHLFASDLFKNPAAFPYADALATTLSIFATFLMAYKRIECWILWILVDLISIVLYLQKGVLFISLEYFILLIMAINGLYHWSKLMRNAKRVSIG